MYDKHTELNSTLMEEFILYINAKIVQKSLVCKILWDKKIHSKLTIFFRRILD